MFILIVQTSWAFFDSLCDYKGTFKCCLAKYEIISERLKVASNKSYTNTITWDRLRLVT